MVSPEIGIDPDSSIAIIGIECRVPGARDAKEFWSNLCHGVDSVREIPEETLRRAGVDSALFNDPKYVRSRAVIDGADLFDAAFFGYTPRQAELMDPQQRLFLESSWHALEGCGYIHGRPHDRVAVFAGCGMNTYLLHNLASDPALMQQTDYHELLTASEKDFLASRVSYKLGLEGPSVTVATACSTSMVAVHLAIQSILSGECEIALAGGASIPVPQDEGFLYVEGGILSKDGRCRPFDAKAGGISAGSGVAIVVLKRLPEALSDRDHIHAVIRGSAVNNDGDVKAGFTAPSVQGQTQVILEALSVAGVDPGSIGYVEAHGTGTLVGDPLEVAALSRAYGGARGDGVRRCAIGSVKSNIGHLDTAAGVVGLIKAALSLHHKQIPPTLHFEDPNPEIDFARTPFFVNTRLTEWGATQGQPRRAAVSSFGLGGTNAHVVLEEAPATEPVTVSTRPHQLLVASAKTASALTRTGAELVKFLRENAEVSLEDAAFTLACGRREFSARQFYLYATDSAVASEREPVSDVGEIATEARSIAFLFPGGGSQYVGMGEGLYRSEPAYRQHLDSCAEKLETPLGVDIRDVIFGSGTVGDCMDSASLLLPALFTTEYALAQLWISWGIRPAAMIGHSLGEYVAACISGVFSLDDALSLVVLRGRLLEGLPKGRMFSVCLSEGDLAPYLNEGLSLAAVNAPESCVVSGPADKISDLKSKLSSADVEFADLHFSAPAHSREVESVLDEFSRFLEALSFSQPQIPWVSNLTGTWITPEESMDPAYWVRHMRQPVRFSTAIQTLTQDSSRILLEVGPGRTLATLTIQNCAGAEAPLVLTSLRHPQVERADSELLLETLGRLWVSGAAVDWSGFYAFEQRRRVRLPPYPFERESFWIARHRLAEADVSGQTDVSNPTPTASTITVKDDNHFNRVLAGVLETVSEVSGIPQGKINGADSFFQLGLDSLALIKVNRLVKQRFGLTIQLADLLDALSEVGALARHIADETVPPEADLLLDRATPPSTDDLPVVPGAMIPADATAGSLHQIVNDQLEIMRRQLEMLREVDGKAVVPRAVAEAPAAQASKPSKRGKTRHVSSRGDRFGVSFTPQQQRHVTALIKRYTRRTAKSKHHAAQYRDVLADSRASVGFRLPLKEILYPIVGARAAGSRFWDLDGNEYIDITNGFGVTLFGHHPEFLTNAFREHAGQEILLGPRSELAGEAAALICDLTGSERASFCNSGTEAVMAAIRLARTSTRRRLLVVFAGSYHGHSDQTLVLPAEIEGVPASEAMAPGIPPESIAATIVLEYGSSDALDYIRKHQDEIAAVLVEPVQNLSLDFQPVEFLRDLRNVTRDGGVALIFDEMISGFRLHPRGAQAYFGIDADIVTYGKVIGGGMPIGVVAGKREFLDGIDGGAWNYGDDSLPGAERTFFGGTFCQHPLTMVAAVATLNELKRQGPALQEGLNRRTEELAVRLNRAFDERNAPLHAVNFGSAFRIQFTGNLDLFFYHLIEKGVYVWEWRGCFLSTAHTEDDLDHVVRSAESAIDELRSGGFIAPGAQAGSSSPQDTFPLTEAQRQLLLMSQIHPSGSLAYQTGLSLKLRGPIDSAKLNASVRHLVERHEALRTVFDLQGEFQRVLPDEARELGIVDFTSVAGSEREQAIERWFEEKNHTPMALDTGPLFYCDLLRLDADEHVLVMTAHHIVTDGWSMTNMMGELLSLYSLACRGLNPELGPAMQYREYVEWQERFSATSSYAAQERYWTEKCSGRMTPLALPSDTIPSAERTYQSRRATLTLSSAARRDLFACCSELKCTPFIGLYAVYTALMHGLTGQRELSIGISVAGRGLENSDALVGYCTHILPVPVEVDPDSTVAEHVATIRRVLGDAYTNSDYPFAALLKSVDPRRDLSRSPLISATFNLDTPGKLADTGDLTLRLFPHPVHFSDFELMLNVIDTGEELILDCDYSIDRYSSDDAERLLASYGNLIESLATVTSQPICKLSLSTPSEQARLLRLHEAERDFTVSTSVPDVIAEWAERSPEGIAIVCEKDRLTYRELNDKANRLAHYLLSKGIGTESMVAVCLDPSLDLIVSILAVLKSGAAYVPLDPSYPVERLSLILDDCRAPILITTSRVGELLGDRDALEAILLDADDPQITRCSAENPVSKLQPESLAYVIYTSGSTGKPKGVLVQHSQLARLFSATQPSFEFNNRDVWTLFHSCAFDFSVWEIFGALTYGGRLVIAPYWIRRDASAFHRLVCDEAVTVLNQTPSAFREFMRADADSSRDPKLRLIIFGGEALDLETLGPWFERHGDRLPELVNMYGITETTVHVTYRPLTSGDAKLIGSRRIGRPIPDLSFYVLTSELMPSPMGVVGEVFVGGAGVARGYLNRPELTRERFIASPFRPGDRLYRTGDLARLLPDGDIEYRGRADNQLKLHGFRIEPGEIEAALRAHSEIEDVVVNARKTQDSDANTHLVAYIVFRDGSSPAATTELREFCAGRLPGHMVPTFFLAIDRIPLTRNGKLDRAALPTPRDGSAEVLEAYAAPRDTVESGLASIWAEVLGLRQVGIFDNFFELGGDSIIAMQVVSRARAAGLPISIRDVHRFPTVAELALVPDSVSAGSTPEIAAVASESRLLPAQRWFFDQNQPNPDHHNMSLHLDIAPGTSSELLGQALDRVAAHHPALRSWFEKDSDGWIRHVDPKGGSIPLEVYPDGSTSFDSIARRLQESLTLSEPPLVRAALFESSEGNPGRLLLVLHHLISDGVSCRILTEDLETAYQQLQSGSPVLLLPTNPVEAWIAQLDHEVQSGGFVKELPYWREIVTVKTASLPLDLNASPDSNTVATEAHATLALDRDPTKLVLGSLSKSGRIRMDDALLGCLTQALAVWLGDCKLLVDLEAHGRETLGRVDPTRTIGWFTSIYPFLLKIHGGRPLGETIREIQETRSRVPRHGLGFSVLKYLGDDPAVRKELGVARTEILFNYLGQFDQVAGGSLVVGIDEGDRAHERSLANRSSHRIEINSWILDGRLLVDFAFSSAMYRDETIQALANSFESSLRELCQPVTESALEPETDLSEVGLRRVLQSIGPDRGSGSEG